MAQTTNHIRDVTGNPMTTLLTLNNRQEMNDRTIPAKLFGYPSQKQTFQLWKLSLIAEHFGNTMMCPKVFTMT